MEYARQHDWASVADEPAFVALCARRWQEMGTWCADHAGCDYIGLGTLATWSFAAPEAPAEPPAAPTKKIAPLLAPEHAPPASQGAAEFDLDAFGF